VLGVPEMPLRKIRVAYLRNFCILTVPRIPRVNGLRNGEDAMHTIKLKSTVASSKPPARRRLLTSNLPIS